MTLEVTRATGQEASVIENLMQLYLHDFSEFQRGEIGADGRYRYPYLAHYWTDPDRYPYLIRVDDRPAGFALVRRETDPATGRQCMDVAEFFVLRGYRNRGVGRQAATALWDLFPGEWQVRVLASNKAAREFWLRVIGAYTGDCFECSDKAGVSHDTIVLTFRSGQAG